MTDLSITEIYAIGAPIVLAMILFEEPPKKEDWYAICDRLEKAKNRFNTEKF